MFKFIYFPVWLFNICICCITSQKNNYFLLSAFKTFKLHVVLGMFDWLYFLIGWICPMGCRVYASIMACIVWIYHCCRKRYTIVQMVQRVNSNLYINFQFIHCLYFHHISISLCSNLCIHLSSYQIRLVTLLKILNLIQKVFATL